MPRPRKASNGNVAPFARPERVTADFEMFHEEPGIKIRRCFDENSVIYLTTIFGSEVDHHGNKRSYVQDQQVSVVPR